MPDQATIIDKARQITGNLTDSAIGETYIPDDAIVAALAPVVRDLNAVYGKATGLKEFNFNTVPLQQDYTISTTIGDDVFEIVEVIRSGAFIPDAVLVGGEIDPQTGLPRANRAVIPPGYQADAMDAIVGTWRRYHNDKFQWEVVNGTSLRLMPCPQLLEVVSVRYVTSGYTIDTLPDNTETSLVFAACVGILNGIINRTNSSRQMTDTYGQAQTERLKWLISQRDYYQRAFEKEFSRMAG